MNSMTYRLLPILLLSLIAFGCSDNPTASTTGQVMPVGTWVRTQSYNDGGEERQLRSTVVLTSQTTGALRDSFFVRSAGSWELDSATEIELHFASVGDGYLRAREVDLLKSDTTVRYWYFFRRGDSLYYYRGMRFLGKNAGLNGAWGSDSIDLRIDGASYSLNFAQGQLTYGAVVNGTSSSTQYGYSVAGDTLSLHGGALPFGDRYEVFPGWSLYITNHASGYARRS